MKMGAVIPFFLRNLRIFGLSGQIVAQAMLLSFLAMQSINAEESHPGQDRESKYAEAVLAFNKRQMGEVLRILDELLLTSPKDVEALELQALTLKTKGDELRSIGVYEKLIQLKPLSETGSYHFELGILYNQQKKFSPAKTHFEQAIFAKINEVPSHFFLGMIAFNGGELKTAEKHFLVAKAGTLPDLKLAATYFVGLIRFKEGSVSQGAEEFVRARSLAQALPDSPMSKNILEGTDKVLAPFDKSRWFGTLSLLGQYDSNITQQTISNGAASESATPKILFTALGGWMSPASGWTQWVFSYRTSYNKNLNASASAYEFFSNVPSLYLNIRPLSPVSFGLKLEGSYTFQNQSPTRSFGPYSQGTEAGPFFKYQSDSGTQFLLDASMRPAKYLEDSSLDGTATTAHAVLKRQGTRAWLNPGLTTEFTSNPTQSVEHRYRAIGFGLTDQLIISQSDTAQVSLDYLSTNYAEASTPRLDKTLTFRMSWTHLLNKNFSVLGDLTYIKNSSSLSSSYSYDRYMLGTGISWNL